MPTPFVHLRLHTEFSLVDGIVRVKPLIKATAAAGMPAVAVTDACNLFAAVKFYKAAVAAGVKPIFGVDLWVQRERQETPFRLALLCRNAAGYKNLTELVSRCYLEGRHAGVPMLNFAWLEGAAEGLIALSGGREGEVGRALLNGNAAQAERFLDDWRRLFPDCFYLELQRTGRPGEESYVHAAVDLAQATATPVVATNDVRFLRPADFEAHEARVCIHEGRVLADPRRPRHYSEQQYLRTPAEMAALFKDLPEALENSVEIAMRCNLRLELGKSYLPDFPVPEGLHADEYFALRAREGLEKRLPRLFDATAPDYRERREPYDRRLEREIGVIVQMGFPGYFLIVADFIQWAKQNGIPVGPGRGSGAGSLVAYALEITDLDPLQYDLLFERFLNPERVSMPDFDVDFCMENRDRVIEYVAERYGRDKVSQIATHGTMAAKAVVRDVGRVLGHPYGFVDKIAKLIPFEIGMTLDKALEQEPEFGRLYREDEEIRYMVDLARSLEGLARSVGKHAGGVVIAPSSLTDFSPLYCEQGSQALVTQFDKDDVEAVGLVKFDFLGLRTLTIIDWAVQTINRQRSLKDQPPLDISAIRLDDKAAFELLKACKTTAVFQLESRGMKDLIKRLQPDRFEDIVALVALFRPGPLQSGMVDDFIDRKHGRAKVEYPHPELEPVLEPTYGVILYQEQVMQIAQVLAGYTLGGADLLRRCLSGSTEVVDAETGRRVNLRQIAANSDYWLGRRVFSLNLKTHRIIQQPIAAIYPNGVREVWEITTKTHHRIKATADHLFYTLLGWKPLSEFKSGDRIGLARTLPVTHVGDIKVQNQSKHGIPPEVIGLIASAKKVSGMTWAEIDRAAGMSRGAMSSGLNFQKPPTRSLSRHRVRNFATALQSRELQTIADSEIFWDTVVSIEYAGKEDVFDLTIPEHHNFIADDFIAHNCMGKKKPEEMAKQRTIFTEGASGRGVNPDTATYIFDLMEKFAGYGFNKCIHGDTRLIDADTGAETTVESLFKHFRSFRIHALGEDGRLHVRKVSEVVWNGRKPVFELITAQGKRIVTTANHPFRTLNGWTVLESLKPGDRIAAPRRLPVGASNCGSGCADSASTELGLTSKDTLPVEVRAWVNEERLKSGLGWRELEQRSGVSMKEFYGNGSAKKRGFRRATIARLAVFFGSERLRQLADSDVFWDQIVKIESKGIADTYDLSVEIDHNFVANGLIVHNSHSAAYALVSYQTAWLKAHYPAAFMAAVLSSDMDNTDKVVPLIEECRLLGLKVQPPNVNASDYRFTVDDAGVILYGLGAIKGVGQGAIEGMLEERTARGAFKDLFDLCRRVDLHKLNRRVLEALIKAGAFDDLGSNRATLTALLPEALRLAEQNSRNNATGQEDIFGLPAEAVAPTPAGEPLAEQPEWDEEERLAGEKQTLGLYLTGHPITRFEEELKHVVTARLAETATEGRGGDRRVVVAGLVIEVRTRNSNRGGRMAFVTLDDRSARLEIRVFSENYEKYRELLVPDQVLVVEGKLTYDDFAGGMRLNTERIMSIDEARNERASRLVLSLDAGRFGNGLIEELAAALAPYRRQGRCPVWVDYARPGIRAEVVFAEAWKVQPAEKLLKHLRSMLGEGGVRLEYR